MAPRRSEALWRLFDEPSDVMPAALSCPRPSPPPATVRSDRGFTLIELMTTISVLAVSLALAAPALSSFIRSNRMRAAQGELVSSLMLARSEAARRGVPVGVEAKADAAGGGFARGWTVWIDGNANGTFDSSEATLRSVPDFGTGITLTAVGDVRDIVYSPRGFLVAGTAVTVKICGMPASGSGYRVLVEPIGLADTSEITPCP